VLSEGHRADILLDLAGLDKNERTMIQASIGNARDFDKIAEALIVQHPRVQMSKSQGRGKGTFKGKRKGFYKGKGKGKPIGKFRFGHNRAHLADDDWFYEVGAAFLTEEGPYSNDPAVWDDGDEEDADAFNYDEDLEEADVYYAPEEEEDWTAYVADEHAKNWEVADPHEAAELECVACLFQVLGSNCDQEDPEACAAFMQDGVTALLAKKGKSKGKGKYPIRPSNLTIADRKKKLQELKARTECKDCGRKGHWKGDKECTMRKQPAMHLAIKDREYDPSFNLADDGEGPSAAHMAVRVRPPQEKPIAKAKAKPIPVLTDMQWTFPEDQIPPEGGDRKFTTGSLRGKTFLDLTLEHPEQYFTTRKSKTLPTEAADYVKWVERYFVADEAALQLRLPGVRAPGAAAGSDCAHKDVHHKGSSARYIKTTCKTCNETWREERDPATKAPGQCQHLRTDHRGSNKHVWKTFCIDCGTHIESVAQSLAVKDDGPTVTAEEQALLDRVKEHDTITKEQIVRAAQVMLK
jgi:hypothetical protein